LGDLSIDIQLDKEKKTITISDKGVGMTGEEVDKYLNQVAFSGAEEFLSKYKGRMRPILLVISGWVLFRFYGERASRGIHEKL
jgi:HSP90 family molecular chaperone